MKHSLILTASACVVAMAACNSDNEEKNTPYVAIELTQAQTRACVQNNDFALSYLKANEDAQTALNAGNVDAENTVVSPFTVYGALGMLANGASGETRREIVDAVGFDDIDAVNSYYMTLASALPKADRKTDIRFASSVWLHPELPLKENYLQTLATYYNTESHALSDDPAQSVKEINKWASEKTGGKISSFLKTLNNDVRTALYTATYFKGKWAEVFKKENTAMEDFHKEDGSFLKKTAMMNKDDVVNWYHHDKWDAIDLDYGNSTYRMTVVLPAEGTGIRECLDALSPADLTSGSACFLHERKLDIKLPKFIIAPQTRDLIGVLGRMGIHRAFDPGRAEFPEMSQTGIFFDTFHQSTMINVDEEGTEASSVAGGSGAILSPGPAQGCFYADRPFIFLIRERSTGTILFAGILRNPQYV